MPFQTSVSLQQSPGIEGGFHGANPHYSLTSPDEGMWVAGSPGPFVGRFAWANTANGKVTSAHPGVTTVRVGFVHRDQPAVISGLVTETTNQVVAGQGIGLLEDGPMWARFAAGATIGQKVYASYATGACRAAATGSAATATGTTANTTSGSANLASVSGTLNPGEPISGTGIPAGTYIVSVNAGAGTAVMSANASATNSAVALTRTTDFETAWTVRSTAGNGELAKISVRG